MDITFPLDLSCGFYPIRFPSGFYRFGEDQTFWLQLATGGARAIFSTNVEAFGGSGVNIYSDNIWGSVKQVDITRDEIRYRKHCLQSLPIGDDAVRYSKKKLGLARHAMMCQLLHHMRRGAVSLFIKQILSDPLSLIYLPAVITSFVMNVNSRNGATYKGNSQD